MYGLSAGIWTDKGSKIFWMAQRLKAGVVWANTYNKFDPSSPFGGYKESGFGREGGRQGLLGVRRGGLMMATKTEDGERRRTAHATALAGDALDDAPSATPTTAPRSQARVRVRKAYKMFVGRRVRALRVGALLRRSKSADAPSDADPDA